MKATLNLDQSSDSWPRKLYKLSQRLKNAVQYKLQIKSSKGDFFFMPQNRTEYDRYRSLLMKEPGTIDWLDTFEENDVFYDIGANLGLYSIYAAKKANGIKVYAFEPHKPNFVRLMENAQLNRVSGEQVIPISVPLGNSSELIDFNYLSTESGSSMNQLGHTKVEDGSDFTPSFREIVHSISVDKMIAKGAIEKPNHIKIDVDGNEGQILEGMKDLLSGENDIKSLQVEVNHGVSEIDGLLKECGFAVDHKHFTKNGKKKLENGVPEDQIAHNVVFKKTKIM